MVVFNPHQTREAVVRRIAGLWKDSIVRVLEEEGFTPLALKEKFCVLVLEDDCLHLMSHHRKRPLFSDQRDVSVVRAENLSSYYEEDEVLLEEKLFPVRELGFCVEDLHANTKFFCRGKGCFKVLADGRYIVARTTRKNYCGVGHAQEVKCPKCGTVQKVPVMFSHPEPAHDVMIEVGFLRGYTRIQGVTTSKYCLVDL